ncbi:MAG: metallophosphoesterase [Rhizobiaceae bacterium]|nr:metallophosphoesterase [Rhizobiaceae bacterium]
MSLTFAIADIHGRFDLLAQAYAEIIDYPEDDGPHTIIHLGDYIDRGPESRQVIEFLMDPDTVPGGWRRVVLRGNHEDIMRHVCRKKPQDIGWWLGNGGNTTLISYGQEVGDRADLSFVPAAHLDWIERLPVTHMDAHRLYVHGGVDPTKPLQEQNPEIITWFIYPRGFGEGYRGLHVVHGHEQQRHGPELYAGRTNLDVGAFYTGRLVVGVFDDDKPGGPVAIINVGQGGS